MLTKTPAADAVLRPPAALPLPVPAASFARWRSRLAMLAMSLLVGWHSLALFVAPAPADSVAVQSLRSVLQPYISLLRLDTGWGFFAPVGKHAQFRYVIKDAAGIDHTFVPTEEPASSIAKYVWWREWKYLFDGIMETAEARASSLGPLLCAQHPELDPLFVTLVKIQEENYLPDDVLSGKRPLDPEYVTVNNLVRVPCRSSPVQPLRQSIRPRRPT
jgi:hypothetical protein